MSFGLIPSFYYLERVSVDNYYLNFQEDSDPELTAIVEAGSYTPTEICAAVASAMNTAAIKYAYSLSFDRDTRKITVTSTGPSKLLVATGSLINADIFELIGFSGSDTSLGTSHESNNAVGSEYKPQFPLQDYVGPEDLQKAVSASVNKTASGRVEVVSFGIEKFYEFNITFITSISQGDSGPIRTNLTGVEDARSFLRFCVGRAMLEYMPDSDNKASFSNIILDKTEEDSNGTGYRLKELYAKGLPGYFETGKLTFRLVE